MCRWPQLEKVSVAMGVRLWGLSAKVASTNTESPGLTFSFVRRRRASKYCLYQVCAIWSWLSDMFLSAASRCFYSRYHRREECSHMVAGRAFVTNVRGGRVNTSSKGAKPVPLSGSVLFAYLSTSVNSVNSFKVRGWSAT